MEQPTQLDLSLEDLGNTLALATSVPELVREQPVPEDLKLLIESTEVRLRTWYRDLQTGFAAIPTELAVFQRSTDGVLVANADGHYIVVNEAICRFTGYSRQDLLHMRVPELVAAAPERTVAEYARFVRDGYWHGLTVMRRKDGSTLPVEARATSLNFSGGSLYLSIFRLEVEAIAS